MVKNNKQLLIITEVLGFFVGWYLLYLSNLVQSTYVSRYLIFIGIGKIAFDSYFFFFRNREDKYLHMFAEIGSIGNAIVMVYLSTLTKDLFIGYSLFYIGIAVLLVDMLAFKSWFKK